MLSSAQRLPGLWWCLTSRACARPLGHLEVGSHSIAGQVRKLGRNSSQYSNPELFGSSAMKGCLFGGRHTPPNIIYSSQRELGGASSGLQTIITLGSVWVGLTYCWVNTGFGMSWVGKYYSFVPFVYITYWSFCFILLFISLVNNTII